MPNQSIDEILDKKFYSSKKFTEEIETIAMKTRE